jgi:hypothetical protein
MDQKVIRFYKWSVVIIGSAPPLEKHFEGRVMASPAPRNGHQFQGWVTLSPAPENGIFTGR